MRSDQNDKMECKFMSTLDNDDNDNDEDDDDDCYYLIVGSFLAMILPKAIFC